MAAWKKKCESVFLFTFLNTAIIIFCLIYSLNIPQSNQNLSFFSWLNWNLLNWIELNLNWIELNWIEFSLILIFLSVWFYYCQRRETCVCFWWKIQSSYFVYRFQALKLNSFEYLRFSYCYGKTNKETLALVQWHMIGKRLFDSEPIGNVFYLHVAIIKILMQRFVIKPPTCWVADVSKEMYQLLLLFGILPLWWSTWTIKSLSILIPQGMFQFTLNISQKNLD